MGTVQPTTKIRSSTRDSKKSILQEIEQNQSDKSSKHLTPALCEKEIVPSSHNTTNSSKMISADTFLPTHSASSVNSTSSISPHHLTNLTAITLGSANNSDSLPPPPPSYSRLPPDGHEFPPDYKDPSCNTSSTVYRVSI